MYVAMKYSLLWQLGMGCHTITITVCGGCVGLYNLDPSYSFFLQTTIRSQLFQATNVCVGVTGKGGHIINVCGGSLGRGRGVIQSINCVGAAGSLHYSEGGGRCCTHVLQVAAYIAAVGTTCACGDVNTCIAVCMCACVQSYSCLSVLQSKSKQ